MSGYSDKLDELEKLADGWAGLKSVRPTAHALATARNILPCPLRDGGIQINLHAGGTDLEIEIGPDGKVESVCVFPVRA